MIDRCLPELFKARWREFRREPSAFFWVIFMPIVWMLILGYSFSEPKPESFKIAVVGFRLPTTKQFQFIETASRSEAEVKLRRGETVAILTSQPLAIAFDQTNPEALRARDALYHHLQKTHGRQDPLPIGDEAIQFRASRYIDFLIPGLLALSIMTSSFFGLGMTIVSNRRENVLKRLLVTPMKKSSYIISHIYGRCVVFAYELSSVLLAGWLFFGYQVYGNFLAFLIFALLGVYCFAAMALLMASRTTSIPTIGGIINLLTLGMIFPAGVFFSTSNLPAWLNEIAIFFPLTALTTGLRQLANDAVSLGSLFPQILVLLITGTVCAVSAKIFFRWQTR